MTSVPARFLVVALLNTSERPERWLNGWEPGDTLATVDQIVLTVDADGPGQAADVAWQVGNRAAVDAVERTWPSWVRSMSIGDVVVVHDHVTGMLVGVFACRTLGWDRLDEPPPYVDGDPGLDALVASRSAADPATWPDSPR